MAVVIKDRRDYAALRREKYLRRLGPPEDQLTRLIQAIDPTILSEDGRKLLADIAAIKAEHPKPRTKSDN